MVIAAGINQHITKYEKTLYEQRADCEMNEILIRTTFIRIGSFFLCYKNNVS